MSEHERSELSAFHDLEGLVHHLVEELAAFRRRALRAEARLRELESPAERGVVAAVGERIADLECENESLRARVDGARTRTRQILDRVHFLRQQTQIGGGDL